jgi:hypothetical protein
VQKLHRIILLEMVRPGCALDSTLHLLTGYPVTPGLDSIKPSNGKVKGRPVNFGTVIPGFYRSGFPQTEDYEYLKSLGLKTIV